MVSSYEWEVESARDLAVMMRKRKNHSTLENAVCVLEFEITRLKKESKVRQEVLQSKLDIAIEALGKMETCSGQLCIEKGCFCEGIIARDAFI